MPETATLEFVIPPELKRTRAQVIEALVSGVVSAEAEAHARRRNARTSVLGQRRVRKQSPTAKPSRIEPFGRLSPTVAARDARVREGALLRKREFLLAYREARTSMLNGTTVPFPLGTYWLRRFASVPIA
jgi:hypothetical protein